MMRNIFLGAFLFLVFAASPARAEFKIERVGVNYLNRQSAALDNHYMQYNAAVSLNKFINPSVGLEYDQTEGEMRRYYVGNRIQFLEKHAAVVRYNRVEYPHWDIYESIINIYYENRKKHFQGAAGVSYHMVDLFGDEMDQMRLNFALSYGWEFFQDRMGFRVGINNFNEFENFDTMLAYNEAGAYIDIHTRIRKHFYLNFNYEPRFIGLAGGHPVLGRETWLMGLSWRD